MDDQIVDRGDQIQSYLESTAYKSFGLGLTRDTRATVDQVLDPKTIEVLHKMQKQGVFKELAGCISTGKEANVYFGICADGTQNAVKVYKTSILGFRDRDEYVDGEFRFRRGYCKSNPRKMVALWAEKEQRNLNRLAQCGLHSPRVVRCKRNVLVMTLIGEPSRAAPRLKDACDPLCGWESVYLEVVQGMRTMFQDCKLVHGDLSEYNMLLDCGEKVAFIDVSQSVGVDHPRSLEFLKRDCLNVNEFFLRKLEGAVVPLQELFQYIINPTIVRKLQDLVLVDPSADSRPEDSLFMQTWVPSSLSEIGDVREVEKLIEDRKNGIGSVFDSLLGGQKIISDSSSEEDDYSESSTDSGDEMIAREEVDIETCGSVGFHGHIPEGVSKQDWKKIVKEENRENRKHKVPKHLKNKRNLKKYGSK
jgi:RIO kinase 1